MTLTRPRSLTLALAFGLLALGAPHASAAADSQYAGGCSFDAVDDRTGTYRGQVSVLAVVYSQGTPADNPVAATITCFLKVNGVEQPGTRLTVPGIGVVAGAGVMQYQFADLDWWEFCEEVDYTNNATPTSVTCYSPLGGGPPPQEIDDAIGALLDQLP